MATDERTYTSDDVANIVRLGLERKTEDSVSHEDLLEIAGEYGLSADEVDVAVGEVEAGRREEARRRQRMTGFRAHAYSYLGTCAFLLLVDLATPGPWWFQWPTLGWGLGLFFHYVGVIAPSRTKGA